MPVQILRFFADPIGRMLELHARHGGVAPIAGGARPMVCVFGAEHNRTVLSDPGSFHNNDQMLVRVPRQSSVVRLNTSLIMANGSEHRRQRRILMPAFAKARIEGYRDRIVALAGRHLDGWRPGRPIDLAEEATELTMRVAMDCLFGLDTADEARELGRLAAAHLRGLVSAFAMLFPFALPGTPYRALLAASDALEARIAELIRRKRAAPPTDDVLSILVRMEEMPDVELLGQASLIFLAGHETTASTLAWTLFLLGEHPRVAADLVDELTAVLGGAAPTVEQLARLPLLDRVVKESMRLLPACPLLFVRHGMRDFVVDGRTLQRGTAIVLSPLVTHRQPDLYPEPARFRPERWATIAPTPYEYLPFGAGPRMCLGAGFAALELRLVLAMLLQRFRLELIDGARVSGEVRGITFGPRGRLPMVVHRQDRAFRRTGRVRGGIGRLVALG
jgi:cytochrome P450